MVLPHSGPQLHLEFPVEYTSPTLLNFVLFINNLLSVLSEGTQSALYVDDTKIFCSISLAADCERVPQPLANFILWNHDNNIQFNRLILIY